MSTIVTRAGKGSALTHNELDANFNNLNTDKIEALLDDTSPQLAAALDLKGQIIGPDSTRAYQIIGNQTAPSADNYDSFNSPARVHGPVTISEVDGPTNRVHSNPRLSFVKADAGASGNQNFGRLRHNYVEGVYELDGFGNTTSGFGKGHNGMFVSSMARNSHASGQASTLTQQTGITVSTQLDTANGADLTVTDCRVLNLEPNLNQSDCTVTTLYGLYYNSVNSGTISNQYSLYGEVADASAYNAGGFQLPVVTVSNLSTLAQRQGNTAMVTNNTAGTPAVAKCTVFLDADDGAWKLTHEPGTTATQA